MTIFESHININTNKFIHLFKKQIYNNIYIILYILYIYIYYLFFYIYIHQKRGLIYRYLDISKDLKQTLNNKLVNKPIYKELKKKQKKNLINNQFLETNVW